jgi:hypothetical protein
MAVKQAHRLVVIVATRPGEALEQLTVLSSAQQQGWRLRVRVFSEGGIDKAEHKILRRHGWLGGPGTRADAAAYMADSASPALLVPPGADLRELMPSLSEVTIPEPAPPAPVVPKPPVPAPVVPKPLAPVKRSLAPGTRQAVFLVATHNRPQLLAAVLHHLSLQQVPAGWDYEILVAGQEGDPGQGVVARFERARFFSTASAKVTDKLNHLAKHTEAELLLMADDDDLQPPNRLAAAVRSLEQGAQWSGSGLHRFLNTATGAMARWDGRAISGHVGTSISITRQLFLKVGGYPSVAAGKDGHLEYRIRTKATTGRFADISKDIGEGLICLQHGANINTRPFPAKGEKRTKGKFSIVGEGHWTSANLSDAVQQTIRELTTPHIHITITSFNRPGEALALLRQVQSYSDAKVSVALINDFSTADYTAVEKHLLDCGWTYTKTQYNHGKRGYFKLVREALVQALSCPASTYYFIQDDMILCPRFFPKSQALWEKLPYGKGTLYLFRDNGDRSRWTGLPYQDHGWFEHTGWVDCAAFMYGPMALRAFSSATEPPVRWFQDDRGSGTGRQLSMSLKGQGLCMYRAARSLAGHSESESQMNPAIRARQALVTADFDDRVVGNMATIARRADRLPSVVRSILPQVDHLNVYLNDHEKVPSCLNHPRISVFRWQDHGDRGDAGKFFRVAEVNGLYFTFDDDIIYPSDYVAALEHKIDHYHRKVVVGVHGSIVRAPFISYKASRRVMHYRQSLAADTTVHLLGTGTTAFDTSCLRLTPEDFEAPNMADVWFGLRGQTQGVPFVAVERVAGWLRDAPSDGGGIYEASMHNDQGRLRDQVLAEHSWRLGRTRYVVRSSE